MSFYSLGLIKKMVQYAQQDLLSSLCSVQNENLGTLLVEVVASVLDNEVSSPNHGQTVLLTNDEYEL